MNLDKVKPFLQEIASKYGSTVIFHSSIGENEGATDGTNIYLGDFDCVQKMFLSFFHELAHINLARQYKETLNFNYYTIELACWNSALIESAKHNIFYEDEEIRWGLEKANTYCGWNKREFTKEAYEKYCSGMYKWKEKFEK